MRVLAIIPARGGSKGVPGKNLRVLGGETLLARAVATARRARSVERVVVSTEDPEIAAAAHAAGAEVVDRPPALAGDGSSSEAALLHALEALAARDGYRPDAVVFLQCTAPFTEPGDLDGTVETLQEGYDCAFAAAPFHGFVWGIDPDHGLEAVDHEAACRPRRQERPPRWLEAGSVYAFRTDGFLAAKHRFFGRIGLLPVPPSRVLEIDGEDDLARAERLLAGRAGGDRRFAVPDPLRAVVLDFDGVLTDNRVLVLSDGTEGVVCHRADGHGLSMLRAAGIELLILSAERDPVVTARAAKLGIPAIGACADKPATLDGWLGERGIGWREVVFVGNDIADAGCLERAGYGVAVADALPEALAAADWVLTRPGGRGAVRELCDLLLAELARRGAGRPAEAPP